MTGISENPPTMHKSSISKGVAARAIQILVMFLIQALELFLGAGTLDWVWAWVFLGIGLINLFINAYFMLRTSPETIAERGKPKEVKTWDKWVGGSWLIGQYFLLPVLCALDFRFGWTGEIALGWQLLGAIGYALSLSLVGWAMISNTYFSTAVRIQSDRGQQVCRTGPYRFVRHPGYVGFFFQALSVPLLLGSAWALLFAIPIVLLMVIRTAKQDRLLQEELPGYREYALDVKYRPIPWVW